MKRIAFILLCVLATIMGVNAQKSEEIKKEKGFNKENCTCNGIPLKGKVKVVTSFPDFKVQIVNSFPDLRVKTATSFPNNCGEWQFVESFPDFTVQFVVSFPDFKIKFVESFPGIR
ncbi:hypothetical protein FACS189434_02620 [Bacteroidia bacterium]|nr:hypothetical protein FACS189434_02620 [Bacteroidia bacterium]